ncbi:MAG: hypothetical protein HY042_09325 [Spirochaetia bacterium]|nr:hypothetical protein [Spirochaetia bacterium]
MRQHTGASSRSRFFPAMCLLSTVLCFGWTESVFARQITIKARPVAGAASFQIQWLPAATDTEGPVHDVKQFPVQVEVPSGMTAFRLRALNAAGLAGTWSRSYNVPTGDAKPLSSGQLLKIAAAGSVWRIRRSAEGVQLSRESGAAMYAGSLPADETALREGVPVDLSAQPGGPPVVRILFQSGSFLVRADGEVRVEFLAPVSCSVRAFSH